MHIDKRGNPPTDKRKPPPPPPPPGAWSYANRVVTRTDINDINRRLDELIRLHANTRKDILDRLAEVEERLANLRIQIRGY